VLSGTPAPNDESEYWAQVKMIDGVGNLVFNDNFYAFRNRYFYAIPLGCTGIKKWLFKKDMYAEFKDKIAQVAQVVRKQDCLDLPEQIHEIREVTLSNDEQAAYNRLKKDLVLKFSDETILASTALTEIMKLRQLTSGFCYGTGGFSHVIGKSKLNELKTLLEEIGNHQVIIWCNFKYEIQLLLRELGNHTTALWSGTVDKDRTIKTFQEGYYYEKDEQPFPVQYLIANPQSAAHGLSFTNCSYAIYFSMNYSYELQKQSEDRIHRIGQDNKCTYYYLVAKNTVDKTIYNTVRSKSDLSKQILDYLNCVGG